MVKEKDIFRQAHTLARSGDIVLPEGATSADCLDELEKQQIWLEHFNSAHPELKPIPGTMSAEEIALLGVMRAKHPSLEDGIWAEL